MASELLIELYPPAEGTRHIMAACDSWGRNNRCGHDSHSVWPYDGDPPSWWTSRPDEFWGPWYNLTFRVTSVGYNGDVTFSGMEFNSLATDCFPTLEWYGSDGYPVHTRDEDGTYHPGVTPIQSGETIIVIGKMIWSGKTSEEGDRTSITLFIGTSDRWYRERADVTIIPETGLASLLIVIGLIGKEVIGRRNQLWLS